MSDFYILSEYQIEPDLHDNAADTEANPIAKKPAGRPAAVPRGNPAPFAPIIGRYWPIITNHRMGRTVSFDTTDGRTIGYNGRKWLANRSNGKRYHVGVDLFGNLNDPVVAIADGKIINRYGFCCGSNKTTDALFVDHGSVVVNYGEVAKDSLQRAGLRIGSKVRAGQIIAYIGRNPGGSTMIHFETYQPGTRANQRWMKGRARPNALLNPTALLLHLQEHGLIGSTSSAPSPAPHVGGRLSSLELEKAVRNNPIYASQVGWGSQRAEIAYLLGFTNMTPNDVAFAQAVADWQGHNGLKVDGMIGSNTWRAMQPQLAGVTPAPSPTPIINESITYRVKSGEAYGPKWQNRRPPGLPANARHTSASREALPHIAHIAGMHSLGTAFVRTLQNLAMTESGGQFARPANIFDARPKSQRLAGKNLITAWGVFQFNRDAWTSLFPAAERRSRASWIPSGTAGCSANGGCVFPWDVTAAEELTRPINRYASLWRDLKQTGASDVYASRGIRLWHRSPSQYRAYLNRARSGGFPLAWNQVSSEVRNQIDGHLRRGSLL